MFTKRLIKQNRERKEKKERKKERGGGKGGREGEREGGREGGGKCSTATQALKLRYTNYHTNNPGNESDASAVWNNAQEGHIKSRCF